MRLDPVAVRKRCPRAFAADHFAHDAHRWVVAVDNQAFDLEGYRLQTEFQRAGLGHQQLGGRVSYVRRLERHRQRIYHQPKGPLAIADSPPRLAHHLDVGPRQGFSRLRIEHYALYHDLGLGISRAVSQEKEGKPDHYYWRKHTLE